MYDHRTTATPDMPEAITITLKRARRLALHAQRLAGAPAGRSAGSTLGTIEHLGYVQIDTISVVERAHHHVLWTRQPGYNPVVLDRLLARDRSVFEYWTHAASYVPMSDYRFYLQRMGNIRASERVRTWAEANRKMLEHVRARIRAEGPLASADFEDTRKQRGSWGDWKPAKRALEILFDSGELMVTRRRHFHRLYDLSERVLPDHVDTRLPTDEEMDRFAVRRMINRMGVVSTRDLMYKQGRNRDRIRHSIRGLVDAGEVVRLRVKELDDPECYALRDAFESSARTRAGRSLHLLSPFDSIVIRRDWLKRMFAYAYRLECYHPEAKRTYGYFSLPVLWGDAFIGRLDAKADRRSGTLIVKHLWFEDDFQDYSGVADPLSETLENFATFNGCDHIAVSQVTPRGAGAIKGA